MRVALRNQGPLVLNEIMALNRTGIVDQANQTSDWIELHNTGSQPYFLNGVYLTDNMAQPGRWRLPNLTIPAGGFVLVWASGDTTRGNLHANFTLSGYGECVGLHRLQGSQFVMMDTMCYGPQVEDVSWGRAGDGALDWVPFLVPSPERSNGAPSGTTPIADAPRGVGLCPARPNPFQDELSFDLDNRENGSNTGNSNNSGNGSNTGSDGNTGNGSNTGSGSNTGNGDNPNHAHSWTILGTRGQTMAAGNSRSVHAETRSWPPGLYHLLWQDRQGQGRCKLLKLP